IAVGLLIMPLLLSVLGIVRIDHLQDEVRGEQSPAVRIVQPSVMQQEKWQRAKRPEHLQRLVDLSNQHVPMPRLVIWPETAFAGFASKEADLLRQTVASATPFDGYLLTGIPRLDEQDRFFNAAVLHSHDGALKAVYDKRHLVPFGEYVPFRGLLPFIDVIAGPTDFSKGTTNKLFDVPGVGMAQILICYEVIFSGAVTDRKNKPDFIVNLTNDGWFGHTAGPWQHLAQSQMRAVEEGMTLIRAANAGISGAFDPIGRPLGQIGLGVADSVDVKIVAPLEATLFAKMGHLLFAFMLLLNAGFAYSIDRRLDRSR
ncbi:MAG: apolipoprotein N-acyltransferase, partial [Candidatus Puniceispirillum sp.]